MQNYIQLKTIQYRLADTEYLYPDKISNPDELIKIISPLIGYEVKEKFIALWLSTANNVIGFEVISEGTLNSSVVHPREVFRSAILMNCNAIIVAHNHQSGNLNPSEEDKKITKKLVASGKVIGIEVIDHLIVSKNNYRSLLEMGEL